MNMHDMQIKTVTCSLSVSKMNSKPWLHLNIQTTIRNLLKCFFTKIN